MASNEYERNKVYYYQNREKIIAHLGEPRLCEVCNREYALYNLSRRRKSMKHIINMQKSEVT